MVNAKSMFFESPSPVNLKAAVDKFLLTIDVSQIIKISHGGSGTSSSNFLSCMIIYLDAPDVREFKLNTINI